MVNRFAHYIVKRGMCKSEEGKNSIDGLIISTKTGRKDRLICKNTVCLELNSVKISILVYFLIFYGFTGKSLLFLQKHPQKMFGFNDHLSMTIERRWSDGEQSGRNYGFTWNIIERAA